jgi:hypothetical protein
LSEGGYIGTVGDVTASDVLKSMLKIREIIQRKKHISKLKVFDFE